MQKIILFSLLSIFHFVLAQPPKLKAGFDKMEYIELLKVTARQRDTPWVNMTFPAPEHHKMIYRSPELGLDNRWDLWLRDDSVAVISLRGSTKKTISWIENLYSTMVPANGELHLSDSTKFEYHLASNPQASVHIGWLIGMASLAPDIVTQINICYQKGMRDFVIFGHSQGGALAYLLRSHLHYLQQQKLLPSDIRIKTYCSAAPKPGNLYYAYSYEHITQGGWGFNVLNTADWVPETPFSIQRTDDFNTLNPFTDIKPTLKKQKFPVNIVGKMIYGQLNHASRKTTRLYRFYLGKQTYKIVKKTLKQYKKPQYAASLNYVRTGTSIILYADDAYYKVFPNNKEKIFMHHFAAPYLYLAEKLVENK